MGSDCEHETSVEQSDLGVRKLTYCFRTRLVDFETFSKILNRPGGFREPGEPEEYCRGFQVFDKDMTGFIGVGQLRYSGFIDTSS